MIMFKTKLFIAIIFASTILIFQACSDKGVTNQIPYPTTSQLIVSPSNYSQFKIKDTVHFVLLTDTLQQVQILWIAGKNNLPLSPRIKIADIAYFSQIWMGDTATTTIIDSKDTLDKYKVIRLNWQIPDSLEGNYVIWFHHYDPGPDTNEVAKVKMSISK
jgi:hypothetical protein